MANFIVKAENFVELRDQQKREVFVAISLESIEQLTKNREGKVSAKGIIYVDSQGIGENVEFLENEFVVSVGDKYVNPKSITELVCSREDELMWALEAGFKYITITSPLSNDISRLSWIHDRKGVKFVLKDANTNKHTTRISPTWVGPYDASSEQMSNIFEFYHLEHSNLESSNAMVRAYVKGGSALPLYKIIDGLSEKDGNVIESLVDPMFTTMRSACNAACMSCAGCDRFLKVYEPFMKEDK